MELLLLIEKHTKAGTYCASRLFGKMSVGFGGKRGNKCKFKTFGLMWSNFNLNFFIMWIFTVVLYKNIQFVGVATGSANQAI